MGAPGASGSPSSLAPHREQHEARTFRMARTTLAGHSPPPRPRRSLDRSALSIHPFAHRFAVAQVAQQPRPMRFSARATEFVSRHPHSHSSNGDRPSHTPSQSPDPALPPEPRWNQPLSKGLHQAISREITCTTAGSSGKMTGWSLVRTVRSPIRRTMTFTGQPQAL